MTDDELLDGLADRLDVAVPPVDERRITALRAAAARARTQPSPPAGRSHGRELGTAGRSRRSWLLGSAAAAVVGAIGGFAAATVSDDDAPRTSPQTEPIDWVAQPAAAAGSAVTGELINHTWGVEVLFDATGFGVDGEYRVAYVSRAGATVEAGGFLGADRAVHCRCNGPLLRSDAAAIEITSARGEAWWRADLGAPAG